MQVGKPVFVFPYSSIPEFCKDYAFYWENENPLSMAKFFLDKTNYFYSNTELSLRIQEYAKQWNWKKTTLQYIELYQSLLGITEKLN
jgi:glycosyltransferase involved in cell wall biosynthesis